MSPPSETCVAPVSAIKLYAERNTGSRYFTRLFRRNFDLRLISGGGPVAIPRWFRAVEPPLRRLAPRRARLLVETFTDRSMAAGYPAHFGWKHAAAEPERLAAHAPADLGVIALVKNPYSWVLSLSRRPYHPAVRPMDIARFVQTPFPLHARDRVVGAPPLPGVLWNIKARSYLTLAERWPATHMIRYEDLLADGPACLGRVAEAFDLPRPATWRPLETSTKDPGLSQSDYRDYYLQERWRADLGQEAIRALTAQLDPDLVQRLGYVLEA